jgi:hypothetical protein
MCPIGKLIRTKGVPKRGRLKEINSKKGTYTAKYDNN